MCNSLLIFALVYYMGYRDYGKQLVLERYPITCAYRLVYGDVITTRTCCETQQVPNSNCCIELCVSVNVVEAITINRPSATSLHNLTFCLLF